MGFPKHEMAPGDRLQHHHAGLDPLRESSGRAPRLWPVSPSSGSLRKPGGSTAAAAAAGPPLAPCRTKRYNSTASESSFPSRLTDPEMRSMVVETVPHLRTSASTRATEPRLSLPTDVERFIDEDEPSPFKVAIPMARCHSDGPLPGDNVLPGFWVPIAELSTELQGGKT